MESPELPSLLDNQLCAICGEKSFLKNFGAISCNACAAFFRRSIVLRKTYLCKNQKNCFVNKERSNSRISCRYCRFAKCIDVGMKAENVRIQMVSLNSAFINELDGILNKLTYFHRSVYYNRMQSIKIKTKSTPKALQNMHKTIYNVFKTESEILQSYFESLGLFDLVYYMDDVEYFFNEALHVWMRFEIGLSTLRNGGLSNNILYYIDNASKSINEDFLYNYYATSSRGKNFDVCARAECDYYHHFLQILTKMYQYRFDEIETSVIRQLLIIITLQESCKRKSEAIRIIDEHKKDLFVSLYKYYKNNDIDYASRLGDLICITSEYQKLITLYNELKSIMDINGIWPMKWKWKWVSEKKLEVAMQFN